MEGSRECQDNSPLFKRDRAIQSAGIGGENKVMGLIACAFQKNSGSLVEKLLKLRAEIYVEGKRLP